MLSAAEKTKIILKRQGLTIADLATRLNISRQNLSNKLSRNNFNEKDIKAIADVLNCTVDIVFIDKQTNQSII